MPTKQISGCAARIPDEADRAAYLALHARATTEFKVAYATLREAWAIYRKYVPRKDPTNAS